MKLAVGQKWKTNGGDEVAVIDTDMKGYLVRSSGCGAYYVDAHGVAPDLGSRFNLKDLIVFEPLCPPSNIMPVQDANNDGSMTAEKSAVKTLESMGYEYRGGELWAPPLGQKPQWLDNDQALTPIDMAAPGYELLADVLQRAYNQAAIGKGKERHANGEAFENQVMQDGAKRFGVGSLLFQAYKKSEESQRLPLDRGVNELLGAIVYLAGAVIHREANGR